MLNTARASKTGRQRERKRTMTRDTKEGDERGENDGGSNRASFHPLFFLPRCTSFTISRPTTADPSADSGEGERERADV